MLLLGSIQELPIGGRMNVRTLARIQKSADKVVLLLPISHGRTFPLSVARIDRDYFKSCIVKLYCGRVRAGADHGASCKVVHEEVFQAWSQVEIPSWQISAFHHAGPRCVQRLFLHQKIVIDGDLNSYVRRAQIGPKQSMPQRALIGTGTNNDVNSLKCFSSSLVLAHK